MRARARPLYQRSLTSTHGPYFETAANVTAGRLGLGPRQTEALAAHYVGLGAKRQVVECVVATRAFSDHSGSYPELTKKFAHSVGVNSSMISAMAAQRSSTVRAAAFLSNALSFEKACSMGLKSGE